MHYQPKQCTIFRASKFTLNLPWFDTPQPLGGLWWQWHLLGVGRIPAILNDGSLWPNLSQHRCECLQQTAPRKVERRHHFKVQIEGKYGKFENNTHIKENMVLLGNPGPKCSMDYLPTWRINKMAHSCPGLGIQSSCQMMIGVYNHLLSKVFRFHETILSLGDWIP